MQKRGFSVEFPASNNLSAGRTLPDSLRLKGGAGVRVTAVTDAKFPGVLVLSSTGIPNLRKLHRLAGPTAARPYGRKVHYPGEEGTNTAQRGQLPQIAFDLLAAIANAYLGASITYATAQSPY
ncbi:hypothetical protein [Hymenobacter mellowenesis]|uniref:hypothetical protein n=1 Tax=Hymenobacter mellowenesis TaxID=3063995 RepID=UPI00272BFE23|nr:hypothetical protein [Hymenobacter sp. M29]